ncbi:hypothetical protein [Enterovibrio coralii]|uniref:Uncharacterized protein n=1 Tax=Enterovibrio coralii TaxID=294935 RepID=A0A135I5V7_9GAMM|nr:hypothetical protein [Enterovibrio coralii]KXF80821.1 hypothetical protein ATN88_16240 [Enterovibrio coralii]
MLKLLRNVLPLLLAVMIGWQGIAFAEHKGSHHHEASIDHHCVLCALGLPSTTPPTSELLVSPATFPQEFDYLFSSLSLDETAANARDPPFITFKDFYS